MNKSPKPIVDIKNRVSILKNVSIFSETDDNVLEDIANAMSEMTIKTEETVFKKGDKGREMYVIIQGAVRIHDGTYVFNVLRQGQVFGEYALLDPDTEKRSASVTSVVPTRLLMLEQDTFYKLMGNRLEILKGILKELIKRSRRQNYYEEKMDEQSKELAKQRDLIKREKQKSDELLLNILPKPIAEELKVYGKARARQYKFVSVLFADIKGFTTASESMTPAEVLKALEYFFSAFDNIIDSHNLEKIKTIGDAYMCAGGIPTENKTNPINMVLAALEMQNFMKGGFDDIKNLTKIPQWELRLGINTGPLIAGVIGKKKFVYDVWGDTVNTASRMETAGIVNRINVSENTYQYIKDLFECEFRGEVDVKGKGKMKMYFVNRIKSVFSEDDKGLTPNRSFWEKIENSEKT